MNKLDLRQVGTVCGHELYVNVADIPDYIEKDEILSVRDLEEFKVRTILEKAFNPPKDSEPKPID